MTRGSGDIREVHPPPCRSQDLGKSGRPQAEKNRVFGPPKSRFLRGKRSILGQNRGRWGRFTPPPCDWLRSTRRGGVNHPDIPWYCKCFEFSKLKLSKMFKMWSQRISISWPPYFPNIAKILWSRNFRFWCPQSMHLLKKVWSWSNSHWTQDPKKLKNHENQIYTVEEHL